MKQDNNTDPEISEEESEYTGGSTLSSENNEDIFCHQQQPLPQDQACWD